MEPELLTIGAMSYLTGVAPSALRYYEAEGLIHATRSSGGQRRYAREIVRRVSFIKVVQEGRRWPRCPTAARRRPRTGSG